MLEGCRCWSLEWTFIRGCSGDHNPNVEEDVWNSEGDNDACDGGLDCPHISRQAANEGKEDDLEHNGEALDEESERGFLEAVELALAIATPFNRIEKNSSGVGFRPFIGVWLELQ